MNLEELIRKAVEEMAHESATCKEPPGTCEGHAISAGIRSTDGTELAFGVDDHRVFAADLARRLGATLNHPYYVPPHLERRVELARWTRMAQHIAALLLSVLDGPTSRHLDAWQMQAVDEAKRRYAQIELESVTAEEHARRRYAAQYEQRPTDVG